LFHDSDELFGPMSDRIFIRSEITNMGD